MKALRPWPYAVVYTLLAIAAAAYERMLPSGLWGLDTPSYLEAYRAILSGGIHPERTPLYPLFIGGISDFFSLFTDSSHAFKAVMMSQWAVFFISVHYFRRSLELLSLPSRW
ncbi:MAG: hypothetical protein K2F74_08880, partial [Muribaculaceae bacterium]|nr:hypothetical protein [Muribaculaceae bacterium]